MGLMVSSFRFLAEYEKDGHQTDITFNIANAKVPTGPRFEDYNRGQADAYKNAPVKIEQEYHHYSMYSFSVHFVKLRVHTVTGRVKIDHVVSCADAGAIVSPKTAESQMIGGAVGGIGMALMEDLVIDHRFGRPINNNLADYHVPVNADIPKVDVLFVNKKDPYTNPMGSKELRR